MSFGQHVQCVQGQLGNDTLANVYVILATIACLVKSGSGDHVSKQPKTAISLFLGAGVLGALSVYPSTATAVHWRQYSATGCAQWGGPLPSGGDASLILNGIHHGMLFNEAVQPDGLQAFPIPARIYFQCPVIEDDTVYGKGGAKISATFETYPHNWGSSIMACKTYDTAVGGYCSQEKFTNDVAPGVKTITMSAADTAWTTAKDYGYIFVTLGSRSTSTSTPNTFKGYWLTVP
jgi:hypothetical protein